MNLRLTQQNPLVFDVLRQEVVCGYSTKISFVSDLQVVLLNWIRSTKYKFDAVAGSTSAVEII